MMNSGPMNSRSLPPLTANQRRGRTAARPHRCGQPHDVTTRLPLVIDDRPLLDRPTRRTINLNSRSQARVSTASRFVASGAGSPRSQWFPLAASRDAASVYGIDSSSAQSIGSASSDNYAFAGTESRKFTKHSRRWQPARHTWQKSFVNSACPAFLAFARTATASSDASGRRPSRSRSDRPRRPWMLAQGGLSRSPWWARWIEE